MKNEKYRRYLYWGVTAFVVLALLVAFIFVVIKWGRVAGALKTLQNILAPVIYGAVLAYLLTPVYNWIYRGVMRTAQKLLPEESARKKLAGAAGTVASLVLLVVVVVGLISMLIPQLISSIKGNY